MFNGTWQNQLFRNLGPGGGGTGPVRFEEVTGRAGDVFGLSEVSRGTLFGDLDNDGDTDLVVINNSGPARLLLNQAGHRAHWLGLRLVQGDPPRDALGARVAVHRPGRPTLWRHARSDGSYASANDPRVLVGLGVSPEVTKVEVHWPGGPVETFRGLGADRYHTLRRGSGEKAPEPSAVGSPDR